MQRVPRRTFLKSSMASLGAAAVAGRVSASLAADTPRRGPNDTIRVAVVGVNGQGRGHIGGLSALKGVEVAALCDVDDRVLNRRADELDANTGRKVARIRDIRKLLEDKSIDAVSIATPNHWHTLAGIWAMQAGKDAYVEKPCSHTVWEGRQLVKAARKYNRLCQHGMQGRCSPAVQEAIKKLREGVIGEVYMARGLCYKWRPSIGKVDGPQPVPAEIDYDLWLGPAPHKPPMRKKFHYDWHWFWDYGDGDIGNQGVHEMDMARWGLGVGLPSRTQSMGGRFIFDDGKETFNTQTASFFYPEQNKMLQFEVRPWITNREGFEGPNAPGCVVLFYGSEGYMVLRYFSYKTYLGEKYEPGPVGESGENRWETFIRAVRSRRVEDLGVDIEEGHLTSALCHLANISARLGRTINFDPATERCPGDTEADAMLKRTCRAPFVVPEDL
ncbi:MAG TPA: Gfo/Idh/MocA family oxidoreductase [Phycisphaerae bacterium]|nr:Gfo/Idh/MocA family oxidoreductase [Phycisphaerae bacterium]